MADVRVGIVSYNTVELLDACLAALPAALGELDAEVVVVDNASSDGSASVAERHMSVRVIQNPENVGYARAMNQALSGSTADVLIALNPDTAPGAGSLEALVGRLIEQPRAGVVVPRLVGADGLLQHSCYRFPSISACVGAAVLPPRAKRSTVGRRLWLEGAADHRQRAAVDWAIGAVHVMRAEAVGARPYSERWFMYAEDIELCWRLHEAGFATRLEGDIEVAHVGNASGRQRWSSTRQRRYWLATYDFLTVARGRRYARRLAAVNAALAVPVMGVYRIGSLAGAHRDRRSAIAGDLRASLGAHVEVARHGAPEGGEPPDLQPA